MAAWIWAVIIAAAVVVAAVVVRRALAARRTRTVADAPSRRDAEAELAARAERRSELDIQPLPPGARERYVMEWQGVQAQFVDDPDGAVREADLLIQSVMRDRGYPTDDFDQRAADVSVDHPDVVENYREGHRLARASALGDATTEDLRRAMQHYRSLFDRLLDEAADAPVARDPAPEQGTVAPRG